MRERLVVPADHLYPSATLSFDQLALVETLSIGGHAVARGAPVAGERALVIGAGPIGLSVSVSLRRSAGRARDLRQPGPNAVPSPEPGPAWT